MTAIRHHDPVTPDVGGPHPRRSRWWWVGGAFLLLLVVIFAFILGRGGRTETPVAAAPTVRPPQTPAGALAGRTLTPRACRRRPRPRWTRRALPGSPEPLCDTCWC